LALAKAQPDYGLQANSTQSPIITDYTTHVGELQITARKVLRLQLATAAQLQNTSRKILDYDYNYQKTPVV
jgi:hypothetical protein